MPVLPKKVVQLSEVKKHNKSNDIWLVINNTVYDVTSFLEEHPGGSDALMDFAGQNATQAFNDVGHSADARELLKKFKIGDLCPEDTESLSVTGTNWIKYAKMASVSIAIGILCGYFIKRNLTK